LAEGLVERDATNLHFRTMAVRDHWVAAGYHEALAERVARDRCQTRARELLDGVGATAGRNVWRSLARDAANDGVRQLRWGQWRSVAV